MYYTRDKSLNELPPRQEALLYLAQELGQKIGGSFLPSWQTARRYIYEMDELEAGLEAFRYQRWEEAIGSWKLAMGPGGERLEVKDKNNKKAAACAAANIAIAYEMLGDYSSACVYANEAYRLFGVWKTAYGRQQQVNIRYYQEQLQAKQVR